MPSESKPMWIEAIEPFKDLGFKDVSEPALISIAISLKRLADLMEIRVYGSKDHD